MAASTGGDHGVLAALETAWLLREHVLASVDALGLAAIARGGLALPLLRGAALGAVLPRLGPLRARALLLDIVAGLCSPSASSSPSAASWASLRAAALRSLVSRPSVAAALLPRPPVQHSRRFYVDRNPGDPVDALARDLGRLVPDGGFLEDDHYDYDDENDDEPLPPPQQLQQGPQPDDVLEPVRRMRDDPRSALAVALSCCRAAAAAASDDSGELQLVEALDEARAFLVPEGALPSDLDDCLPLVCSLGSPELLRCLGRVLGHDRVAAASHGKFLACVACAAGGDAAGMLRALAQPPFSLGRADVLRGRMSCDTFKFVPGVSFVGRKAFAHRLCDLHSYGQLPVYTLCAACANDDTEALAALAEFPYRLNSRDAHRVVGEYDAREASVQSVLEMACISGSAAAVHALGKTPYALTNEGRAALMGLRRACEAGSVRVLDVLAAPPWSMGRQHALKVLDLVMIWWTEGTAAALRRLRDPPYNITWDDALEANRGVHDAELFKLFQGLLGGVVQQALAAKPDVMLEVEVIFPPVHSQGGVALTSARSPGGVVNKARR
eukprot:m51a1_g8479 hypothetical protein (556) ;mRNA; f:515330-517816